MFLLRNLEGVKKLKGTKKDIDNDYKQKRKKIKLNFQFEIQNDEHSIFSQGKCRKLVLHKFFFATQSLQPVALQIPILISNSSSVQHNGVSLKVAPLNHK